MLLESVDRWRGPKSRAPYGGAMSSDTSTPSDPAADETRRLATKRLKAKHDFQQFLGVWLGVSLLLVAIWAFTAVSSGGFIYFWPAWPIGGMGVAAFFLWLDAYGPGRHGITEADIDAEVERMNRRRADR